MIELVDNISISGKSFGAPYSQICMAPAPPKLINFDYFAIAQKFWWG